MRVCYTLQIGGTPSICREVHMVLQNKNKILCWILTIIYNHLLQFKINALVEPNGLGVRSPNMSNIPSLPPDGDLCHSLSLSPHISCNLSTVIWLIKAKNVPKIIMKQGLRCFNFIENTEVLTRFVHGPWWIAQGVPPCFPHSMGNVRPTHTLASDWGKFLQHSRSHPVG